MAIWDRTPEETQKSWAAFTAYRDLPPNIRSVVAAAAIHYQMPVAKAHQVRQCHVWVEQHDWYGRAAAWDAHVDAEAQAATITGMVATIDSISEMRRRHALVGREFLDRVTERMKTLDVDDLSAGDLARWAELAVRIEREAIGASDDQRLETEEREAEDKIEEAKRMLRSIRDRVADVEDVQAEYE